MSNSIAKNFEKAAEAFATTLVAGLVAGGLTEAAKVSGAPIPPEFQQGLVMTGMMVLAGAANGVRNWWKHRKKK